MLLQYSIQAAKPAMTDLHEFFDQIAHPQGQGTSFLLSVSIPAAYQTFHMSVTMINTGDLLFEKQPTGKKLRLKSTCRMEPKYDLTNSKKPALAEIRVHCNGQHMILTNNGNDVLKEVYDKLRMLISHKGFTDWFKPVKKLGRGAFATVYLVESKITRLQFAAKVFSREGQKLEFKGQEALLNEIRTLRFLSHPNIIQYQGVFETDNLIYLVTEYLSGGTLEDFMRNKCRLTGELISSIIVDTLTALTYLQKNNVMHRDLKPENILLREKDQKWVLADFGLSAFTNEQYLYDRCGTMGYMAPEVLAENVPESQKQKPYNYACDLYSLGVICYSLIIGSLPFKVQSQGMFDKKIVWDGFNRPECQTIHPEILIFLKGLLETDPLKRITASEALQSSFFNSVPVISHWNAYNQTRISQRYEKILRMANPN